MRRCRGYFEEILANAHDDEDQDNRLRDSQIALDLRFMPSQEEAVTDGFDLVIAEHDQKAVDEQEQGFGDFAWMDNGE